MISVYEMWKNKWKCYNVDSVMKFIWKLEHFQNTFILSNDYILCIPSVIKSDNFASLTALSLPDYLILLLKRKFHLHKKIHRDLSRKQAAQHFGCTRELHELLYVLCPNKSRTWSTYRPLDLVLGTISANKKRPPIDVHVKLINDI